MTGPAYRPTPRALLVGVYLEGPAGRVVAELAESDAIVLRRVVREGNADVVRASLELPLAHLRKINVKARKLRRAYRRGDA